MHTTARVLSNNPQWWVDTGVASGDIRSQDMHIRRSGCVFVVSEKASAANNAANKVLHKNNCLLDTAVL